MKRLRKRWLVLAAAIGLYGTLVLSDHGVLYWLTDTTQPHRPGTIYVPTFRCHYFTGTGIFSFEASWGGFGAESCSPLKRPSTSSLGFAKSRFA